MADSPQFALYVSSVPGRTASRPGSPFSYIGVTVAAGEASAWSPDVVVPILATELQRYIREYGKLLKNGDLVERTEADFKAYSEALAKREAARDAELAKVAEAATQPLPGPAPGGNLPPIVSGSNALIDAPATGIQGDPIVAPADGSLATLTTKSTKGSK